ncbi:MAG: PHP domain-containing protein [Candidatus Hydrogenedentes bacterium]|nr:PHP domain-containing protein [Candidatus Hydrogenedentota bacterium]
MIPPKIFPKVKDSSIDIFAICDHNSAWNVRAFCDYGKRFYPEIVVIPGIEITTQEEIHVVSLFPTVEVVEKLSAFLEDLLPQVETHPNIYYPQQVVNFEGKLLREVSKPLYYSVSLDLEGAVRVIKEYGGIVICAHVDRPSFSVVSQLGVIPEGLFDVVEISPRCCEEIVSTRNVRMKNIEFSIPPGLPIIASSDAHSLDEIGIVKIRLNLSSYKFESLLESIRDQIQIEVMRDD